MDVIVDSRSPNLGCSLREILAFQGDFGALPWIFGRGILLVACKIFRHRFDSSDIYNVTKISD